ncbi:hypothetical protein KAU32_02730 [bacterium]|nr:hypothetical protein [bacterium]
MTVDEGKKEEKFDFMMNLQNRLSALGLLAISAYVLIQLVMVNSLDEYLEMAVIHLSIAIPFLAATVLAYNAEMIKKESSPSCLMVLIMFIGSIESLVALGCVFRHFSKQSCTLFIVACVVACAGIIWNNVKFKS